MLQQQYWKMKLGHILFAALLYLTGYYLLLKVNYFKIDPLLHISHDSAPIIHELVQTKFFRIIRINLNQECQIGHMNKICKSKSCSVCRCDEKDIPFFWSSTDPATRATNNKNLWGIERQLTESEWVWHVEDLPNDKGEYFDIFRNVESFTNYNGSYIWQLIYQENCFHSKDNSDICAEERILYQIISGLHTSISTHLSRFYRKIIDHQLIDPSGDNRSFQFNYPEYQKRVLNHPDRIQNLLFLYRILAKAINQISPYLYKQLNITSDNSTDDVKARQLMGILLQYIQGYDLVPKQKEVLQFFKVGNPKVKQIQRYIHNISKILNCVECQKCRLFGKMQTYGVGTALKILLGYPTPYKRNEIVALFNVFNKITMSVDTYYNHRKNFEDQEVQFKIVNSGLIKYYTYFGILLAAFMFSYSLCSSFKPKYSAKSKKQ